MRFNLIALLMAFAFTANASFVVPDLGVTAQKLGTNSVKGYINGFQIGAAGGTISIAAGQAMDSTGAQMMVLTTALNKTFAAWSAGSAGGLDTGASANAVYYVFIIKNPTTKVVDALISQSATAPTMPSGYTLKRRIFSGYTGSTGSWYGFDTFGDEVVLRSPCAAYQVSTTNFWTTIALGCIPNAVPLRLHGWIYSKGVNSQVICTAQVTWINTTTTTPTGETLGGSVSYYPTMSQGGALAGEGSNATKLSSTMTDVVTTNTGTVLVRSEAQGIGGGNCVVRFWLYGYTDWRSKDGLL